LSLLMPPLILPSEVRAMLCSLSKGFGGYVLDYNLFFILSRRISIVPRSASGRYSQHRT
jgi:hypothetical protein